MGTVVNFIRDGLANILTGRGTSVDRQAHNIWLHRPWSEQEVAAAYRSSWLHRKIIDIPAQDMTRAGRDWDATDDEIAKIEAEEKRLGYWPKLRQALTLGRLGGGAIFIGLGDDAAQPLTRTARPIEYLTVFSRWQLTLGEMVTDPVSPLFGQPSFFELNGSGRAVRIHPSRMVCFHGLQVPTISTMGWEDRFWGDSVVQAVDEAVKHASTAADGFASLIDEAKVDIFRFGGMVEQLGHEGGEAKVMQRVQLTQQGKSIHRGVILDKEDEWEQRQINWAGMRDVIITFDGRVAGAADIPATRLFGKAPDGMNATGDGDLANYFQGIGAKQEMDLRPAMERLDAVLLPSAGVPATLSFQFSPLMVLTEQQQADVENKEADTVTKYANAGLIPESALAKAVQNRLVESQRWPGLADAIAEAEAAGEELPDDPSEIVPITKGGDPVLPARGRSLPEEPRRRAANDARNAGTYIVGEQGPELFNDATPRTLYVSRKVQNVAEIAAWAREQGLPELQDGLHVTIAYSRAAVDWIAMGETYVDFNSKGTGELVIKAGGPRVVEPLGDRTAVLMFASSDLSWRNMEMREKGASWDWPDYQPHVSLTGEPVDLSKVEPYRGKIVLGPEVFEEIRAEGEA